MLDLRVLDYYESLISQYMNDQELTPLILGGMGNIAGGKTEFKNLIINSTLFSEEEQNSYLTLLYSSEYEIKEQMIQKENRLPDYVVACVGGGSNAIGCFYPFIDDKEVQLVGVEAGGEGVASVKTAATLNTGKVKVYNGFKQYVLVDENDEVKESYSISAGLDYPGCGPEHCYLYKTGRAKYGAITDDEAVEGFLRLSKLEGIIPAIESSHAVAYLEKLMPTTKKEDLVVVNISGRGDKDTDRLLKWVK